MSGWQVVEKKKKSKKKILLKDVPRSEWCEWDEESRKIYLLLRQNSNRGVTAAQLAKALDMTKEDVGQFLYSDDMQPYVERRGNAPDRVWRIKRQEQ